MAANVVQIAKARILKALGRRGVVRVSPEALELDDAFAARDPVLSQLAVYTRALRVHRSSTPAPGHRSRPAV